MNYINFFQTAMQLKNIRRTGWVRERINNSESVADHSFMTAFLTQMLYEEKDVADVVQIALFHDVAESHIGDIVWERGNGINVALSDAKHKQEFEAANLILKDIVSEKLLDDVKSFVSQSYSKKAKFVREIEKLEMSVQALIYELESGKHNKFDEFWESARSQIHSKKIQTLFDEFEAYRIHNEELSTEATLILSMGRIKKTFHPFIKPIYTLKQTKRQGWIEKKVPKPESVAEHCFGVSVLASTIPTKLNRDKLVLMSIIHDLAEAVIGDQIWEHGTVANKKLKSVKDKEEQDIVKHLLTIGERPEYYVLFEEFSTQSSPEAKFLKELDKLEMIFQALEYELGMGEREPFNEFWENANKYIKTPEVRELYDELYAMRLKVNK